MRVQCTFWSQIVSQSGSPPPHAHTMSDWLCTRLRCVAAPPLLVTRYEHQILCSLSLFYKTIFHTVFGPKIWALILCCTSRYDLLNSPDPTHSVLMIATNQNANANWRWRNKIIYQSLEAKDWRSILLIMKKEVQGIMICTHTRPPHAFAFSTSPGDDKWWQTVLEIRMSCNQREGSACTHGVPKVFFCFDKGEEMGHVGFWLWPRKRWNFFSSSQKRRQKCVQTPPGLHAGEGSRLTEMNATSWVLHIN